MPVLRVLDQPLLAAVVRDGGVGGVGTETVPGARGEGSTRLQVAQQEETPPLSSENLTLT